MYCSNHVQTAASNDDEEVIAPFELANVKTNRQYHTITADLAFNDI